MYNVRKVTLRNDRLDKFLKNFQKTWHIENVKTWHTTWLSSTDLNGQSWGLRLNTNGLLRRCSTPLPVSTFLAKLGPCAESYVEKCPF